MMQMASAIYYYYCTLFMLLFFFSPDDLLHYRPIVSFLSFFLCLFFFFSILRFWHIFFRFIFFFTYLSVEISLLPFPNVLQLKRPRQKKKKVAARTCLLALLSQMPSFSAVQPR